MQEYLADLSYVVPFIKPNQAFPKGRMFYTLKAYMPFFKKAWLYFVLVEILLSNILPFGKAWLGLTYSSFRMLFSYAGTRMPELRMLGTVYR